MADAHTLLKSLRRLCLALPEVSERLSHGSPTFFIRDKKVLCTVHAHEIDSASGTSIWVPAPPGVQEQVIEAEPERFYRPPYVGHRGWIGVRLDRDVDWDEVDHIVRESYRLVAPKTLVKQLDGTR